MVGDPPDPIDGDGRRLVAADVMDRRQFLGHVDAGGDREHRTHGGGGVLGGHDGMPPSTRVSGSVNRMAIQMSDSGTLSTT